MNASNKCKHFDWQKRYPQKLNTHDLKDVYKFGELNKNR